MYKAFALLAACFTLAACQSTSSHNTLSLKEHTLAGNWTLNLVNSEPAEQEYGAANIQFTWEKESIKVNGSNGCNLFFGNVRIESNQLKFAPLASTLRACTVPLMKQEQAFMKLLADPTLSTELHGETLLLKNAEQSLLFIRAPKS